MCSPKLSRGEGIVPQTRFFGIQIAAQWRAGQSLIPIIQATNTRSWHSQRCDFSVELRARRGLLLFLVSSHLLRDLLHQLGFDFGENAVHDQSDRAVFFSGAR